MTSIFCSNPRAPVAKLVRASVHPASPVLLLKNGPSILGLTSVTCKQAGLLTVVWFEGASLRVLVWLIVSLIGYVSCWGVMVTMCASPTECCCLWKWTIVHTSVMHRVSLFVEQCHISHKALIGQYASWTHNAIRIECIYCPGFLLETM